MLRSLLVAVLVLAPTYVVAQSPSGPAPSIGLPLPAIGLPLPAIGISPDEPPTRSQPSSDRPPLPARPAIVFFGAPYAWGVEAWQQSAVPGVIPTAPAAAPPVDDAAAPPAFGRLQLEITPRDAQVFVNDEFVGTWSDLAGALDLPAGTHRIELRAPRYQPVSLDARIAAGRTITYRAELTARAVPPARTPPVTRGDSAKPAAPPKPRQTFYLIPGCYLGNIPPEQVKLPEGCDLERLITHTPGQ
jgi:hypothetical protein